MIKCLRNISKLLRMNLNRNKIKLMIVKQILQGYILFQMKIVMIDKNYIDNVYFWKIKWTV